jgi:Ca2+-binding RTX toxin-like protein
MLKSVESIRGGVSDDTLIGNSRTNVLDGFGGDDTIRARGGDDVIVNEGETRGVPESGHVFGGKGADGIHFTLGVRASLSAGLARTQEHVAVVVDGVENLYAEHVGSTLVGDGGPNVLSGGSNQDDLRGGGGNDSLLVTRATILSMAVPDGTG